MKRVRKDIQDDTGKEVELWTGKDNALLSSTLLRRLTLPISAFHPSILSEV